MAANSVPGYRVLVVDRDPLFNGLIQSSAARLGCEVVFCKSRQEVDRLKDWQFDLMIIDYDLPGQIGPELIRFIKEQAGSVPVILVSGISKEIRNYPDNVIGFLYKEDDVLDHILDLALQLLESSFQKVAA